MMTDDAKANVELEEREEASTRNAWVSFFTYFVLLVTDKIPAALTTSAATASLARAVRRVREANSVASTGEMSRRESKHDWSWSYSMRSWQVGIFAAAR